MDRDESLNLSWLRRLGRFDPGERNAALVRLRHECFEGGDRLREGIALGAADGANLTQIRPLGDKLSRLIRRTDIQHAIENRNRYRR